jgi:hypothetical protein
LSKHDKEKNAALSVLPSNESSRTSRTGRYSTPTTVAIIPLIAIPATPHVVYSSSQSSGSVLNNALWPREQPAVLAAALRAFYGEIRSPGSAHPSWPIPPTTRIVDRSSARSPVSFTAGRELTDKITDVHAVSLRWVADFRVPVRRATDSAASQDLRTGSDTSHPSSPVHGSPPSGFHPRV